MADDPAQDPSSQDSAGGADGDQVSEGDLDALLAEASSLADEISTEVGEPDGGAEHSEPAGTVTPVSDEAPSGELSSEDVTAELDARMVELDGLMEEAGGEVGTSDETGQAQAEPDSQSKDLDAGTAAEDDAIRQGQAQPEEQAAPAQEASLDVPAFMDEFTRPGDEGDAVPAEWEKDTSIPDLSDPGESKTAAVAEKTAAHPTQANSEAAAGQTSNSLSPQDGASDDGQVQVDGESGAGTPEVLSWIKRLVLRFGVIQRIADRLSPLAIPACERGIHALEVLDNPVQRLGDRPRQLIGWLAIATIGTSILVFLVSLF